MLGAETEAAVDLVREQMPDATVGFRGPYCKIERDGELDFDMAKLGERLGRDIDTDTLLVSMSSYYGAHRGVRPPRDHSSGDPPGRFRS